jgi:pyruvate dehydrogenase E2 component (dihydrolipoamide acetyltransferase)
MEKGVLAKWHKKVGDFIKPGDLIAEIETDKAVVGFEAQEECYLAAILIEDGSGMLDVGTPLGLTVEEESDMPAAKSYAESLAAGGAAEAPAAAPAAAPAKETPAPTQSKPAAAPAAAPVRPASVSLLELPALSPTMEAGVLARWHAQPGQLIRPGDVIAEVETDKAVVGFEAQEECYLAAVLVEAGAGSMPVGTPIGLTVEEEADAPDAVAYAEALKAHQAAPATEAAPAAPAAAAAPAAPSSASASGFPVVLPLSPAVAHMVHSLGLDPASIRPSGPKGRLLKGDVLLAIEQGTAAKAPAKPEAAAQPAAAKAAAQPAAKAAPAASKPAAKAPAKPAAAATPGMSARRAAARTFVDVPLSEASRQHNADVVQRKQDAPHLFMRTALPLAPLRALISTYAREADVDALLMKMLAAALPTALPAAADKPFAANVYSARSGATAVVDSALHAPVNAFAAAAAAPEAATAPAPLSLVLLGEQMLASADFLRHGAAVAATIAPPAARVQLVDGEPAQEHAVLLAVAFDAAVVPEERAAAYMERVRDLAQNPLALLL